MRSFKLYQFEDGRVRLANDAEYMTFIVSWAVSSCGFFWETWNIRDHLLTKHPVLRELRT